MKLHSRVVACLTFLVVVALFAGCKPSGAEYKVAPVKGKVVYNGEAVKGGSITFRPVTAVGSKSSITGKPASGIIGDDGTFVLSTYANNDGAVVGKHEISYTPIMEGAKSYDDKPAPSPYLGLVPKEKEVEIKAGQNDLTVELVKGGQAPPANP